MLVKHNYFGVAYNAKTNAVSFILEIREICRAYAIVACLRTPTLCQLMRAISTGPVFISGVSSCEHVVAISQQILGSLKFQKPREVWNLLCL